MKLICSTCGINVTGQEDFVKFDCPECGETVIIRCRKCKKLSNKYVCEKCGFEGP
ncbi:MAG: zinc finger domain-containing protein [Methanosarcinales archaeon]